MIKNQTDIKELIYSHISKNLRQTGVLQVILAIEFPITCDYLVILGCLSQLQLEDIGNWDLALRDIEEECSERGGLNQTL